MSIRTRAAWALAVGFASSNLCALAEAPAPGAPAAEGAPADEATSVIVSGDGFRITVADVEAELAQQPGRAALVRRDASALKEMVGQMVRLELLAREAKRRGYDQNPAVVQAAKEEAVQELNRTLVDAEITPASISLEEITTYYEANRELYERPAMRRARHILLEKKEEAEALLPEAQKANDYDFQKLARAHSIDTETNQRGGDLRFFARESQPERREAPVHPALRAAAFGLTRVGDTVAAPVEVDGRYSILRLTGIRAARETSLTQAEPSIRTRLWREKRRTALNDLMQSLRTRLKPEVFAKRIEGIDLSDVSSRPTGFAPDPPLEKPASQAPKAAGPKP